MSKKRQIIFHFITYIIFLFMLLVTLNYGVMNKVEKESGVEILLLAKNEQILSFGVVAWIIGIAVFVGCFGGFIISWFLIRHKTFKELKTIFKRRKNG